jgi:hypothetical protein
MLPDEPPTVEPVLPTGTILKKSTAGGNKRLGRPLRANKEVRKIDPDFGSEVWIEDPETRKYIP